MGNKQNGGNKSWNIRNKSAFFHLKVHITFLSIFVISIMFCQIWCLLFKVFLSSSDLHSLQCVSNEEDLNNPVSDYDFSCINPVVQDYQLCIISAVLFVCVNHGDFVWILCVWLFLTAQEVMGLTVPTAVLFMLYRVLQEISRGLVSSRILHTWEQQAVGYYRSHVSSMILLSQLYSSGWL